MAQQRKNDMKKRMKMKRYQEGDLVDDDSPESQKVYRSDLTEISDEERRPRGMASFARKAAQTGKARAEAIQSRSEADTSKYPSMTESPRNAIRGAGAAFDRGELTGSYRRMSDEAESGAKGRPMTERESTAANVAGLAAALIPVGRVLLPVGRGAKGVETLHQARQRVAGEKAADVLAKIDAKKDAAKMGRARKAAEKENAVRDYLRGASYGDRATGHRAGGSIKKPVKRYASGGFVSASRRADGIATKGKTKGRFV